MAYLTCGDTNVFGPFDYQYTFLGSSIQSFSLSAGWNEQTSELTVQLIDDCAEVPEGGNPKVYWDSQLNPVTFTSADPGFLKPHAGSPVYFRVADFEFSGIIQGWTESNSEGGKPVYTVRIVDPREILAGTQLIINDYSGGVGTIYNLINVFGFMEKFGQCIPEPFEPTCSETFGSALGFGGAQTNQTGMSWNRILAGTRLLTSSFPSLSNVWSPYGRLVFKGPKSGGYGVMPADNLDLNLYNQFGGLVDINEAFHDGNICYYLVDLDEMPIMPDYFRLSGTNISLLEAITQVCDASGRDYYIELIPVRFGVEILKFIKVRTIDRSTQPILTVLRGYVTDNGVNQSQVGQELRNETTSVFISGGFKETIYTAFQDTDPVDDPDENCLDEDNDEADDMIQPFMGFDALGNCVVGEKDDEGFWEWEFDATALKKRLKGNTGSADTIKINEKEILCAGVGIDSWQLWAYSFHTELKQLIDPDEELLGKMTLDFGQGMAAIPENVQNMRAMDFISMNAGNAKPRELELQHNLEVAFNFISTLANEYYGKKFMVRVPHTCIRQDPDTGAIIFSEEPTDSGWTDEESILGIPNPSSFLDFVSTEEGKIGAFVRYDDASHFDVTDLQDDEYGIVGDVLYLRANVEPGYVYTDISNLCSPRAVISINSLPSEKSVDNKWLHRQVGALFDAFQKLVPGVDDDALVAIKNNNENLLLLGIHYKMVIPDAVAIPFRSNINRYGPWLTSGPPGQIRVEVNDDLVPWNYGTTAAMCTAGQGLADEGVTFQQAVETGSITVPGYPTHRVGDEFNAPPNTANVVENRDVNTSNFSEVAAGDSSPTEIDYVSTTLNSWDGSYGPNITDIQVQVGPQGVLTTYSFRTYVQRAGRFSRLNAERLKNIGKLAYLSRKRANTLSILNSLRKKKKKKGF